MKILAIRGRNLASLDGDFEVDLAADPLERAGVFAITGRTGAGKSTLLDALCVALFDRTPRLAERGGPAVGSPDDDSGRLGANDVRTLLRRGRGEGYAEVDFVGRDHRTYRARWEVRRAREKADGRLQNQTMTLTDLGGGEGVSGNKTEVKDAIQHRLGLDFDQFRRSVLLAQGDFAAFLQATGDERASLLERITGRRIYTDLSIAAFERAKAEREALERLEHDLARIGVLDEEARRALEQAGAAAEKAVAEAEARAREAQQAVDWHAALEARERDVRAAEADLARAREAVRQAADRRDELAATDAAEPLRRPWDAAQAAAQAVQQAEAKMFDAAEGLDQATADLAEARAGHEGAQGAREAARSARQALAPALAEARRLDTRIEGQQEAAAARAAAAADADRKQAEAADAHAEVQRRLAAAEEEVAAAARAVEAGANAAPLEADWSRWDDVLGRLAQGVADRRKAEAALAAEERSARALEASLDQAARVQAEATGRQAQAAAALAAAEAAAGEASASALADEARQADGRRRRLQGLRDVRARLVKAEAERAACQQEIADHTQELEAARTAAGEAQTARRELEIRLQEQRRAAHRARDAQGLEGRRGDLVPGEPCPLCGSTEHPWAAEAPALDALVADSEKRVQETEAALSGLESTAAAEAGRASALERTIEKDRRRREGLALAAAEERAAWHAEVEAWRADPGAADLDLAEPEREETAEHLAAALEAATAEGARLEARREAAARREAEEKQARALRDAASADLQDADGKLQAAKEAAQGARTRLEQAAAEHARARKAVAEAMAALAPVVEALGGAEAVEADPGRVRQTAGAQVAARRVAVRRHETALKALEALRPEHSQAQERLAGCERTAGERRREADAAQAALAETRAQRARLLEGRAADEVEGALEDRLREADAAEQATRARLDGASRRHASAEARRKGAEGLLAEATARREEAEAALGRALQESGFDRERLEQVLARDETWRRETRQALQQLDQAVASAQRLLEDRVERRESHLAKGAPALDAEAAAARKAAAAQEREAAQAEHVRLRTELKQDDRNREESARLREAQEKQQAIDDLWAKVADVIGSHDGKKLRLFAQSLTLEVLIEQANANLDQLGGRYHLMRVPDTDFDLQVVDRTMGDDIRSVKSLSGGETFMVSLALALGLSSLAAADVKVESLFVDEGFGSLDAQTLETVLGTLDALQATGRQVAVISHVADIAERVAAQVAVVSLGAGRSRVEVRAAA